MKISKPALVLSLAVLVATGSSAQEKLKSEIKGDGYKVETKIKDDKYKVKRKGNVPHSGYRERSDAYREESSSRYDRGYDNSGEQKVTKSPDAAQKTRTGYSARRTSAKKCTCATARKSPSAPKRTVAHRARKTSGARTAKLSTKPGVIRQVVHDTVYVVRLDTVYRMRSRDSYSGYRSGKDNFKKLKIKREDGEIILKKKYEDGEKVIRTFDNEREFNRYKKHMGL